MRSKILFLVAAAAAFSAPAYAGDTDTAQAAAPAAKVAPQIAPPPAGMGQVVFYRPSSMGGLVSCRVSEGTQVVNRLPPGKYFVLQTTPGVHEFSVHSEAKDVVRVSVEDGETAYTRCNISMGFMVGRPNLSNQDRADFEKRGKKLKLQPAYQPKEDSGDNKGK
ncbi:MAG TPA: hypothetical protein VE989_13120 [Sphingomicrobium sp.]|jgi:hypothetical protein|nr:hypothetical protein [Sphingomicrobium sp.]